MTQLLILGFLAGCSGPPAIPETEPAVAGPYERRHVLLLTVDTLRWDHLSINGHPDPTSPAIDKLMKRGVIFNRALAPVARTTPSLTSVLSGRYPQRHRVRTLFDRLDQDVPTLANVAKRDGFRTVAVISNNVLKRKRGLAKGFDVYDYGGDKRDAAGTTQAAIQALSQVGDADKAFVWVHYIDPHVPYRPPEQYAKAFDPGYQGRYPTYFGDTQGGAGDDAYPAELGKRKAVFNNPLDEATNAHIKKLYAADVRGTDDAIAELLAFVNERFGDDFTIVFTADHGESQGEHGYFWDHGDYVWMPGLHVPLSITLAADDPLYRQGAVDQWVSLTDVAPTLVDLMQLRWNKTQLMDGRSLVPALEGNSIPDRPVFAESGRSFFFDEVDGRVTNDVAGRFRAVIDGDFKLIWTPGAIEAEYRLFNLNADPHEQTDIAAGNAETVAALKGHLVQWMSGATAEPASEPDADDLEQLEALGYIGD